VFDLSVDEPRRRRSANIRTEVADAADPTVAWRLLETVEQGEGERVPFLRHGRSGSKAP
jgi:hypothetical protein